MESFLEVVAETATGEFAPSVAESATGHGIQTATGILFFEAAPESTGLRFPSRISYPVSPDKRLKYLEIL